MGKVPNDSNFSLKARVSKVDFMLKIKPFQEDYGIKKPMSFGHGFFHLKSSLEVFVSVILHFSKLLECHHDLIGHSL